VKPLTFRRIGVRPASGRRPSGLREEVEFLYHTAAAIAAERPGFNDRFRMLLIGDSRLINAARSAVQDAAPWQKRSSRTRCQPNFFKA